MAGKTVNGALALAVAGMFTSTALPGEAHAQDGTALEFTPVEMMACSFKEDKEWDHLDKLTEAFNKWLKKGDKDYTYWTFEPVFREDNELDFAWIGGWTSGAMFGKSWDNWFDDDNDVGKLFNETADCVNSLASVTTIRAPADGWPEAGVTWFSRCTLEEGVSLRDAASAHGAMGSAMADMGSPAASWLFLPALGFGDVEFDYYHVESWDDFATLGAGFDAYFNQGGWMKANELMDDVTQCASPNLYRYKLRREGDR